MNTFKVYISNQLEKLSQAVSHVLSTPLESLFEPEVFVVQSHGMSRWLSIEIAKHIGISANNKFYYPNEFINTILQNTLSDKNSKSAFLKETMTWKIMTLLPACQNEKGFEPLKRYLENDAFNIKYYQLAVRIADIYDQYLLFRPEMIFRWEKGEENHWQAQLWRELITGQKDDHRATLLQTFIKRIKDSQQRICGFPERITVFGISALPNFHMEVFAAISRFTEVNLFLVNPCMEYWGVIQSDWEIKKKTEKNKIDHSDRDFLYLEQGNRLLASMGTLGRDFFDLLNDFNCNTIELFAPVKEDRLLSWIQADILNLRDRSSEEGGKVPIEDHDTSIMIHSCHSPMREIEILYDQLLRMFEDDPDLAPKDILVMAPNIEIYAPFIQAVFGLPSDDNKRIPYSIADRSMLDESHLIKTVLSIFKLNGSRFKASEVLWILESRPVQQKFGLTKDDSGFIHKWVADTRIRWGQDAKNRKKFNLPELEENTWKAGLERLLLGYAMAGNEENMFADILPYDHIEGNDSIVLGKLLEFTEQLFAFIASLDTLRTLDRWSEKLCIFLSTFFTCDDDADRELKAMRSTVLELSTIQADTGFDEKVPFSLIEHHLSTKLSNNSFGSGFITGGVTFCAMMPMRSIPFQVIGMLGLNSDAYPRQTRYPEFDLISQNPRPGDRSRRHDDQYIFLESILSARKKIYISYIGQSIKDNSLIPPSVLVSELIEYIENGFEIPGKTSLDHILIKHRLQPFSPDYFQEKKSTWDHFFSYSDENCQGANFLLNPRSSAQPFFKDKLPEPEEEWRTIDLDDLYFFFTNPAKYLLNRRFGIYSEEGRGIIEDKEIFKLGGLDYYMVTQTLLDRELSGKDSKGFFELSKASGKLPHGTVGGCTFDALHEDVFKFAENTKPLIEGKPLPTLTFDINVKGFKLTGRINSIFPKQHMVFRHAQVRAKDFLRVWLDHLVISLLKKNGYPKKSLLAGLHGKSNKDRIWKAWELSEIENAPEIIEYLLEKYWEGLGKPLKFFPNTSYLYAEQVLTKNQIPEKALARARTLFEGTQYSKGESDDFYYQICFGSSSPLDSVFEKNAMDIFKPMFMFLKDIT